MLGIKHQTPDDRLDYDIDFSRWLSDTDLIADALASPADGITVDLVEPFGQVVKVWVSGGQPGQTYQIDLVATTTEERIKEVSFLVHIGDC